MTDIKGNTPAAQAHRQNALDRLAALAFDSSYDSIAARKAAENGDMPTAVDAARKAEDKAFDAMNAAVQLGARNPLFERTKVVKGGPKDGLDLSALATMDTPEARELLVALEHVQKLAERVDASRGKVLPDHIPVQPGESRGTDLAESISVLTGRLRREVYGATGKGIE